MGYDLIKKILGLWSTREIETNASKEVYVRTTIRELTIYMIFLVVLTFCKFFNECLKLLKYILNPLKEVKTFDVHF